jgi:hypothetical protein
VLLNLVRRFPVWHCPRRAEQQEKRGQGREEGGVVSKGPGGVPFRTNSSMYLNRYFAAHDALRSDTPTTEREAPAGAAVGIQRGHTSCV